MPDKAQPQPRSRHDVSNPEFPARQTLADDADPDRAEQGRIGYGRLGRWSPVGLAILILLALVVTYLLDRGSGADDPDSSGVTTTGELQEPRPAPAFSLDLLNSDGSVTLDELNGKTVVLNFWASWCGPCREEMPALQASSVSSGDDVVFVGVGAKNDKQPDAEAFVDEFGITYPIGRDTNGGDSASGDIEMEYGVPGYPATFFITPDGMINQIVFGALDTDELETYIANAAD